MPYEEPTQEKDRAGNMRFKLPPTPWERHQMDEGIPIYRGVGVYDSRELPREPWKRMGGLGTFIELSGLANRTAMYVVEIPPGESLNAERHLYEERFFVLEGRGSTEIWTDDRPTPQAFEWAQYSVFSPPINTWHRIVNATSRPALLLAATSGPLMFNTFDDHDFIFENGYNFPSRYSEDPDYFKPREEFDPRPGRGSAQLSSNLIPDAANGYLPLDNGRGPGYRAFRPVMAGNITIDGFIAEYPTGRYSKAHSHESGAVLVCMRGKGYSYTWPAELGSRPWEAGRGEEVMRQEYTVGGMVSAAPGGDNWYHQHFAISEGPFRVFNFTGTSRVIKPGYSHLDDVAAGPAERSEGGTALPYHEEDPFVRDYYARRLTEEGGTVDMPPEVYDGPTDVKISAL